MGNISSIQELVDRRATVLKNAERRCSCCGGNLASVLHRQDFIGIEQHPLANGYDVVACHQCGFTYADSRIPQEVYDAYYGEMSKYADATTGTGGALQWWDAERLRETATAIAGHLPNQGTASILDIGCANGGLLECLKDAGCTSLYGVDPSPACVSATRAKGFDATQGLVGKLFPTGGRKFDCIVLSHVLEHVEDLQGAMANVLRLLARDGSIYVEVPDATRYSDYLYSPFQDFNTEHINHFSEASLRNLMGNFGLKAVQGAAKTIRSSATSLYPAIYGLYEPSDEIRSMEPDNLSSKMDAYISLSHRMLRDLQSRLRDAIKGVRQIVIWGTGQLAMKVLTADALGTSSISACVDSNPVNHGRRFHGAPIISPDELRGINFPVVITSLLHQEDIASRIRSLGLPNRVVLLRDQPDMPFA